MKTLIMGLGNPLMTDDAIGYRVAEALAEKIHHTDIHCLPADIDGFHYVDLMAGYDRVFVIDAIQTPRGTPGEVHRLEEDDICAPVAFQAPHRLNFATALALGRKLQLALPDRVVFFAIEALDVHTFGESMSPQLEADFPMIVEYICREIGRELEGSGDAPMGS